MRHFNSLALFLLGLSLSDVCLAQVTNIVCASSSMKANDVLKAKECIDKASKDPTTSNHFRMWYYTGVVYEELFVDTFYKQYAEGALDRAVEGYINCVKTDKEKVFAKDCTDGLASCGYAVYNKAVGAFYAKDYVNAEKYYKQLKTIIPYAADTLKKSEVTEDMADFNLYFVYMHLKDGSSAEACLQKLIDKDYHDVSIYKYMLKLKLMQKDTAAALACIEKGRERYQDDQVLLKEEIKLRVAKGDVDNLLQKLNDAISKTPNKDYLYSSRGMVYARKKMTAESVADYQKAISLKPDNFDAYFNMGVMYFNDAVELSNNMEKIQSDKDYDAAKKKVTELLKQAEPFLEKAHEIDPKDKNTLFSLKQLYARTREADKFAKVNALLQAK